MKIKKCRGEHKSVIHLDKNWSRCRECGVLFSTYGDVKHEPKKRHNCGDGFKGYVVKAKGLVFCGFCGREFNASRT